MSWMDGLGSLLQQYTSGSATQPAADVEDHFDQVAQNAPASEIAEGLAAAFRSGETPPFAQMAAQIFGNSGGTQQAGVLNALIAAAGPSMLSKLTGASTSGGLGSILGSVFGGGSSLTSAQAVQVSPEVVQQLAEHAEKNDPSIVDRLSEIYAEHPGLIKTLGGAALTVALAKVAQRQRG